MILTVITTLALLFVLAVLIVMFRAIADWLLDEPPRHREYYD